MSVCSLGYAERGTASAPGFNSGMVIRRGCRLPFHDSTTSKTPSSDVASTNTTSVASQVLWSNRNDRLMPAETGRLTATNSAASSQIHRLHEYLGSIKA